MTNFMNQDFIAQVQALRQMENNVQTMRNEIVSNIIQKMEIDKPYTIEELNNLSDIQMSFEMLSGAFRSLANAPSMDYYSYGRRTKPSSLRCAIGSNVIANGDSVMKRTFFVECDEWGNPIPGGKRTVRAVERNTYIRMR